MKILILGGTGLEKAALKRFASEEITLIGSFEADSFDPKIKRIDGLFDPENPLPLTEYDLIMDLSLFHKSKFHLSKAAQELQKRYVGLYFDHEWLIFDNVELYSLEEFVRYQPPPPMITVKRPGPEASLSVVRKQIETNKAGLHSLGGKDTNPQFSILEENARTPAHTLYDIVAVSCGEDSISVSPMPERALSLFEHAKLIEPYCSIRKSSDLFLSFDFEEKECLLFKKGRIMIKNCNDRKIALKLYSLFVGT